MAIFKVLTIAGSDSGGGAGIQADLKTFQELGVFGMTALTAVTAQNTLGVQGVYPLSVEAVLEQIDSIGTDLGTDAVKTGMLFSSEIIEAVAGKIRYYGWEQVVIDPVMVAKGGAPLLQQEAVEAMRKHLIPLSKVITPNLPEAEVITGMKIGSKSQMMEAAKVICGLGAQNVVIKGGHRADIDLATDLLYDGKEFSEFAGRRIETKNTHGTGCTFAAAVAAELAKGHAVRDAVRVAKHFIQAAIEDQLEIGQGHGPTNHWAFRRREQEKGRAVTQGQ
jgi:hydroxymethylpyrimidine/phosphomethylpyrimidine kinase